MQCSLADSFIIDKTVMEKSSQSSDQRKSEKKRGGIGSIFYTFCCIVGLVFKVKRKKTRNVPSSLGNRKFLVCSATESMNTKSRNTNRKKRKIFAMEKRSRDEKIK
jgi:hypothetical protein